MHAIDFCNVPMSEVSTQIKPADQGWLWDGYLCRRNVTLLTSQWKTGKTTLLTGLLQRLKEGGDFLGLRLRKGRALVVSEEDHSQWADRLEKLPIGRHVELLARPFRGRPNIDEWNQLIDHARAMRERGELDLFVVDPLASFLPGRCESDAATLLEVLQPLHRLAVEGVAILLLHHPRKQPSEEGQSARGSGALLGFVDIAVELNRFSKLRSDSYRRRLVPMSRKLQTPGRLAYEWDPLGACFSVVDQPHDRQYDENWGTLKRILKNRDKAATHWDLLHDWPEDETQPSPAALYRWLRRAFSDGQVRREGGGTSKDPWCYRLPNSKDAYYDRGELPPL